MHYPARYETTNFIFHEIVTSCLRESCVYTKSVKNSAGKKQTNPYPQLPNSKLSRQCAVTVGAAGVRKTTKRKYDFEYDIPTGTDAGTATIAPHTPVGRKHKQENGEIKMDDVTTGCARCSVPVAARQAPGDGFSQVFYLSGHFRLLPFQLVLSGFLSLFLSGLRYGCCTLTRRQPQPTIGREPIEVLNIM